MMNGRDLLRTGGGSGKGTTVISGLFKPGGSVESRNQISVSATASFSHGPDFSGRSRVATLIPYNIYPSTVFGNAHRMVRHSWTAPNVSENEYLDGDFGFRARGTRAMVGSCLGLLRWRVSNITRGEHQEDNGEGRRDGHGEWQEVVQHLRCVEGETTAGLLANCPSTWELAKAVIRDGRVARGQQLNAVTGCSRHGHRRSQAIGRPEIGLSNPRGLLISWDEPQASDCWGGRRCTGAT